MVGANSDRQDACLVGDRSQLCDGITDPGETRTPRAEHGLGPSDWADRQPVALLEGKQFGPEIATGQAAGRCAHFDDERGSLASQGRPKSGG